ncbi:MAG TPA: hypothetical protein VL357_00280 [Rariglobus sp.]|jgi:hypothetical protein|nr:hypothetical protein [Rariglobus sp.]
MKFSLSVCVPILGILCAAHVCANASTTSKFPVYNSGTSYEDRILYSDTSLGTPLGSVLNIGESGVDNNNSRSYISFSVKNVHGCTSAVLYVYLSGNANMAGYTVDLYGYANRGATVAAQNGDYSGGSVITSAVITASTSAGWIALDVTSFATQQLNAGNTALAFKFQVHESGLPQLDGKQNTFALKPADQGLATAPYLLLTHDITPTETDTTVPVYNSGSAYEDRILYSDTSLGTPFGSVLNIGESGIDNNNSRSYIPFSISSTNATLIQGSADVVLHAYLSGNANMAGYTVDLYGYNNRGSTLVAQNGDYSGGTLLASSVITSSTPTGWVSFDITQFAIQQVDAGNTALAFKFQIHEAGMPKLDGKQNTFAFKPADQGTATAPYLVIAHTNADATSLEGKGMAGYQGWFRTPGDVSGNTGWSHWFNGSTPSTSNEGFDAWPDMSEYTAAEKTAVPGFLYPDGSQAHLYSAQNARTVLRHFQWMARAGIDGVWLSQFQSHLPGGTGGSDYPNVKRVMDNVRAAATATGRTWALEYDCSGASTSTLYNIITTQWQAMVDQGYTSDANYLHHNGLPVVMLWGFFYNSSNHLLGDLTLGNQLITYFQTPGKYQATLVGGGQWNWQASSTSADFQTMLMRMTAYSPWNVGHYHTDTTTGNIVPTTGYWASDKAVCDANHVIYLPMLYPGTNPAGPPTATILVPRRSGNFLWEQFRDASAIGGINSVYIAMFDEVNEGTEIMKITNTPPPQSPAFITYEGMPGDWYMRLVGTGEDMLFYNTPITGTIPIAP